MARPLQIIDKDLFEKMAKLWYKATKEVFLEDVEEERIDELQFPKGMRWQGDVSHETSGFGSGKK